MRTVAWMVALGLVGCASSPEVSGASEDALSMASRWRSPLTVGQYDGDDLTLSVYDYLDRQWIEVRRYSAICRGAVDVDSDGKASVIGASLTDGDPCTLTLEPTEKGIDIAGEMERVAHRAAFVRRGTDSLVGLYTYQGKAVTVEASDERTMTLSASDDGAAVVEKTKATLRGTVFTGNYFSTYEIEGLPCFISVERQNRRYELNIISNGKASCALTGVLTPK